LRILLRPTILFWTCSRMPRSYREASKTNFLKPPIMAFCANTLSSKLQIYHKLDFAGRFLATSVKSPHASVPACKTLRTLELSTNTEAP
jgi:hypothetical protein